MTVVVDILERYLRLNQWRKVAEYLTGNSTISAASTTFPCTVNTFYVAADATSGAFNVTLFHTVNNGQITIVKKVDSSANAVTVLPGSGTIDGAASYALSSQWQSVWAIRRGANWEIIGVNP